MLHVPFSLASLCSLPGLSFIRKQPRIHRLGLVFLLRLPLYRLQVLPLNLTFYVYKVPVP